MLAVWRVAAIATSCLVAAPDTFAIAVAMAMHAVWRIAAITVRSIATELTPLACIDMLVLAMRRVAA